MNKNDKENIVVKYNKHRLSPSTILIFAISVIQNVIKKSLTKDRKNIFHVIKGKGDRDGGISEKNIIEMIKKDVASYKLIFHYFDNPVHATIKNKEKKLNAWVKELMKLRLGVLDDYLLKLAETTQISFEETIVTTIKTSKK